MDRETVDHSAHICSVKCVDAHVLGCDLCVAFKDGIYFCDEGARINQRRLKAELLNG